jgi:hypothetical protein
MCGSVGSPARTIKQGEDMTLKDEYYTEEDVLSFLDIEANTLAHRRSTGKNHPPYVKIGKKFYYPKKEFAQWVKSHQVKQSIA